MTNNTNDIELPKPQTGQVPPPPPVVITPTKPIEPPKK